MRNKTEKLGGYNFATSFVSQAMGARSPAINVFKTPLRSNNVLACDAVTSDLLMSPWPDRLRIAAREHVAKLRTMSAAVILNAFENFRYLRKFGGDVGQIFI